MRENIEGTNRVFCIAVYNALRWKANEGVAHDGPFTAAIGDVAHRAGCSHRKAADTLNLLESIGVISITHRTCPGTKERSPSTYTFLPLCGTPFRTAGGTPSARTDGSPVPILERTERTQIAPAPADALADGLDCPFSDESENKPRDRNQTLDALAACKLGRAVGPDAVPVEFIRAAGIFYMRLVAQVCKAAAATGVPFTWRGGMMAAVPRKVQMPLSLSNA